MNHACTNGHSALLDDLAQPAAQALHAARFLVVVAKVFLKSNVPERIETFQQGALLIGLPEKASIVEARPQHALIAVPNKRLRISIGIQHRQKMGQQLTARIFQGKIFLMIAHDGDQHFFRQREELRIERMVEQFDAAVCATIARRRGTPEFAPTATADLRK